MHPEFIAQLARQRARETRHFAAVEARGAAVARAPRPSIRDRAGWTLVHLGLRLAPR
jgi:hypothetical protein